MVLQHLVGCILSTALLLIIYYPSGYAQLENDTQPEVVIPQGILLGKTLRTRNGRNVFAFLGIPYGEPPTGNLRFANPIAAGSWNGTLNATVDPNKCPQSPSGVVIGEEDCLFVKVYTPQLPQNTTDSSLLPVMVYIHGGGFRNENPDNNTPEYLLDADVVLVVLNYRLGSLGFLSTGDEVASGNWGLKDQVLALHWVQDNVHHFGGDPDQVTLFGESAGATAVHLLTLSDATIGLFHRYITQSGSALAEWAHRPRAAYASCAFQLGEILGCYNDTSDSLISCLRTVDFSSITASQSLSPLGMVWGPTDEPDDEGAVLTDSPTNLFAGGKIRDLPWISGVVRDEGLRSTTEWYEDEEILYNFLEHFDTMLPAMLSWDYQPDLWEARVDAVRSYYFDNDMTSNTSDLLTKLTILIGDSQFYYPAYNALQKQHAIAVNPQYFYTFNYRGTFSYTYFDGGSTVNYGVRHGDDLIYLFPKESVFSVLNETMSETDYEMVDTMVQLWTSFAINGTPTTLASVNSGITWEPYTSEDNYLRIGNESDAALEVQYSFFEERMEFWANIDAVVDTEENSEDTTGLKVTIPQGTMLGTTMTTRHGRNIFAFLGIPYGQPPTGNLRFASPVAADGWNGTLNATVDPSKCPQVVSGVVVGEEDCLFVKVYTPQLPQNTTNSSLLPVMVYIHGGAFRDENPDYNTPEYLLDADVVLVVLNYRLGSLGFLSTGDEVASGNWGLKDQVLALKWVQDNVHHFGGDPDQVTIFGESAGSVSVHLLTLSNATIGLFHRYITQSGSALADWAHRPRAAYSSRAFQLGEMVGCYNDTSDSLISCLRTADFSNITASQSLSLSVMVWGPTDEPDVEGAILMDSPMNLFAAGKIRDLPWMSGIVRDEGLLFTVGFYQDEEILYNFLENFDTMLPAMLSWDYQPDLWEARVNAVRSYYFDNDMTSNTSDLLKKLTMLVGDSEFYYPAHNALQKQHALAVNSQYFYTFNYRGTFSYTYLDVGSTVNYGVRHVDELIYLFPKESVFSALNETMSETDYEMVDTMVQLWTTFAINGTPTASALVNNGITWEPYSSEDNYLRIGNESDAALEVQYSFFEERMQFWANIDAAVGSGVATLPLNFPVLLLVACSTFVPF